MDALGIGIMAAIFLFACGSLGYAIWMQDGIRARERAIEEGWKALASGWLDLAKTTESLATTADMIAEEENRLKSRSNAMAEIYEKIYGKRAIN